MGNLGLPELMVIALVALLVFGPDRLPELARQAGRFLARFRQETSRSVAELKKAAELDDLEADLRSMRRDLRGIGREVTAAEPVRDRRASVEPRRSPPPTDPEAT